MTLSGHSDEMMKCMYRDVYAGKNTGLVLPEEYPVLDGGADQRDIFRAFAEAD